MKFYVSARPLRYNKHLITPKETLNRGFTGLNVSNKLIAMNQNLDGRMLYLIEISDEYSEQQKQDYKEVILEALLPFAVHEKTLESAKSLAEILTEEQYKIENGEIAPVAEKQFI